MLLSAPVKWQIIIKWHIMYRSLVPEKKLLWEKNKVTLWDTVRICEKQKLQLLHAKLITRNKVAFEKYSHIVRYKVRDYKKQNYNWDTNSHFEIWIWYNTRKLQLCGNFMKCSCNIEIKSQLLVTKSREIQSHILIYKGAIVWNNVTITRKIKLQLQCIVTMRTIKSQLQ